MIPTSKLVREVSETSRGLNLKDPQIRSLILSIGTRGLALVGSMVFSYLLIRYAMKHLDPTHEEKKRQKELAEIISKKMNLPRSLVNNFNEYEMCLLTDLINPVDIKVTWQDIGGLDEIIDNVRQTVIYPLQHPELFKSIEIVNHTERRSSLRTARLRQDNVSQGDREGGRGQLHQSSSEQRERSND